MNTPEDKSEVDRFVSENTDFLSRVLAHGDAEARSYVLAVIAHGGAIEDIEAVQEELEAIKRDTSE